MSKETSNRVRKITSTIASIVLVVGLMIPVTALADPNPTGVAGEVPSGAAVTTDSPADDAGNMNVPATGDESSADEQVPAAAPDGGAAESGASLGNGESAAADATAAADAKDGEIKPTAQSDLEYLLVGGTAVKADKILQDLSLSGTALGVAVNSPEDEYYHGEQREDGWYIVVDKAFTGTKVLRIVARTDGSNSDDVYEINVNSNCITSYDDLKDKCAKGGTWEITESFQGYSDDGITIPENVQMDLKMNYKTVSGSFHFNVMGKLNLSQGIFLSTHFILSGNAEVSISECDICYGTDSEPAAGEKPPAGNGYYGNAIEVKDNAKLTLSPRFKIARYDYGIYVSGGTVNVTGDPDNTNFGRIMLNGYGVWVEGTGNCTVTDCMLEMDDYGAHIQDDGAKLEIGGKTQVGGNIGGVIVNSGTFQVQGAPRIIRNNQDPSDTSHDVILSQGTVINVVGKLDPSSAIGVKTKEEPAEGKTVPVTKGLKGNGAVSSFSSNVSNWTITEDSAGEAVMAAQSSVDRLTYSVVSGAGSTWTKGSGKTLGFTVKCSADDEGTYGRFTGIKVDGVAVAQANSSGKANYTTASGSLILNLQPSYLNTLATGKHTLVTEFNDGGQATAEFTVAAATSTSSTTSAKTGDALGGVMPVALVIAIASGLCLAVCVLMLRRRRS